MLPAEQEQPWFEKFDISRGVFVPKLLFKIPLESGFSKLIDDLQYVFGNNPNDGAQIFFERKIRVLKYKVYKRALRSGLKPYSWAMHKGFSHQPL